MTCFRPRRSAQIGAWSAISRNSNPCTVMGLPRLVAKVYRGLGRSRWTSFCYIRRAPKAINAMHLLLLRFGSTKGIQFWPQDLDPRHRGEAASVQMKPAREAATIMGYIGIRIGYILRLYGDNGKEHGVIEWTSGSSEVSCNMALRERRDCQEWLHKTDDKDGLSLSWTPFKTGRYSFRMQGT